MFHASGSINSVNNPAFRPTLDLAREGSDAALGELLEGCRQYLLLVANRELEPELRIKSPASDLVQETFVSAGRNFQSFRGMTEAELLAWLRRILLNHLVSQRRRFFQARKRQAGRDRSLDQIPEPGIHRQRPDEPNTPSRHAIHLEEIRLVAQAIQRLEARQRRIIELRHREQLSFDEIARQMELSVPGARQLWARAIASLRQEVSAASSR